eukprot:TRINITY_DN7520_c0_g1_i1.p1 TRINITY_DN7520_c0_g1~~TRINITY_DN7520_c0_g1_i1.p1  ORF type:complete len:116 (-),score=25.16 TRINITY_DN7520_c0_g1_i1:113-460(-)
MISYQQLLRNYDMANEKILVSKNDLKVTQTVRKGQPVDERVKYDKVVVKIVKGVPINLNEAQTMINSIGRLMNGVLSNYRAQSDLAVNIEGVCLVPSEGFLEINKLFLDDGRRRH